MTNNFGHKLWASLFNLMIFIQIILVANLVPLHVVNASPGSVQEIPLSFTPHDSVMDPNRPVVYFTDIEGKKVYALNYETKKTTSVSFDLIPEQITLANDELYVTLLISGHQKTNNDQPQNGAVAILDAKTLSLKEKFTIEMDPFDIAAGKERCILLRDQAALGTYRVFHENKTKNLKQSIFNA